jgi:hypothetical protein
MIPDRFSNVRSTWLDTFQQTRLITHRIMALDGYDALRYTPFS